jgi:protein-tyrosine-phosphatase
MQKILVICHGNKWRSPLCAAILTDHGFEVKSAGFRPEIVGVAKPVRDYASAIDLDLSKHRSQIVDPELLSWSEKIIYMDGGNKKRLDAIVSACKIRRPMICLAHFAEPPKSRIPDPAFLRRGSREFEQVMELIVQSTHNLVDYLIDEKTP